MSSGRGYNTFHGQDTGPPPPSTNPNPNPYQYQHQHPYPFYTQPQYQPYMSQPPHQQTQQWQMYPSTRQQFTNFQSFYGVPTLAYPAPGTHPYATPVPMPVHSEIKGLNFRNPSGGIGLPPGYEYLFPTEHTVIHVFRPSTTSTPPWQAHTSPHNLSKFIKFFVPCQMTVLELMGQLGLDNKEAKKNVVYEVVEKGNGQWARGFTVKGDDKDRLKMKLRDVGWDSSRIGVPGKKPVVWLYITKT